MARLGPDPVIDEARPNESSVFNNSRPSRSRVDSATASPFSLNAAITSPEINDFFAILNFDLIFSKSDNLGVDLLLPLCIIVQYISLISVRANGSDGSSDSNRIIAEFKPIAAQLSSYEPVMEQPLLICISAATSTICLGFRSIPNSSITLLIALIATAEDDLSPIDAGISLSTDMVMSLSISCPVKDRIDDES